MTGRSRSLIVSAPLTLTSPYISFPLTIPKEIERICLTQGYKAVTIYTPEELLEE